MVKDELYISTDIEADGPIPGEYSMLSFASIAILPGGKEVGQFKANLQRLPFAGQHPDTMKWWEKNAEAYELTQQNLEMPTVAMLRYRKWLKNLSGYGTPVFVGYPATWDYMFVFWYLVKFTGHSPFGFSSLDLKTMAMMLLRTNFRAASKKAMPKEWFAGAPKHTHDPTDDAREQGVLWESMRQQWLGPTEEK